VNGTKIKNITCNATANWDTWADEIETVSLKSGNNTIAYKAETSSGSCINLDRATITASSSCTPVAITSQPSNANWQCGGASPKFSVGATGSNLTYAWYFNNNGTPMACSAAPNYFQNYNTATLTVNAPFPISGTTSSFWCVITDGCGNTVTSNQASYMQSLLSISQQPADYTWNGTDQSHGFSVTAQGSSGYKYQWYMDYGGASALTDGKYFSGTQTQSLTVILPIPAPAVHFYCIVTDGCNNTAESYHASYTQP
jgi:hypothetical protein